MASDSVVPMPKIRHPPQNGHQIGQRSEPGDRKKITLFNAWDGVGYRAKQSHANTEPYCLTPGRQFSIWEFQDSSRARRCNSRWIHSNSVTSVEVSVRSLARISVSMSISVSVDTSVSGKSMACTPAPQANLRVDARVYASQMPGFKRKPLADMWSSVLRETRPEHLYTVVA